MAADIPEQLGRYEIVQRLAAGGMGEVFAARFAGPGGFLKAVALKRIHPHLACDEAFIHMLHDEANVTAAIKHPNVVQILEVSSEGDNHFVVLDFVGGETLSKIRREMNRRGALAPLWLVAWVGAEIASALHAAHEARSLSGEALEIIHRDVSLGNIMLADDGRPMLFDFGVAKARQRLSHTSAGELKGKMAYMAPEAFRGVQIDRTVDLYALGVVLYEMITGRSPFQRDSDVETLAAVQAGEVEPIEELRREADWLLSAVITRAMAREREERYQSAAQLEQALREWARKNDQPHDAAAAARWVAEEFPEKLQERRALLARIASRSSGSLHAPARRAPSDEPSRPSSPRAGVRDDVLSAGALTPPPVAPPPSLAPLSPPAPAGRRWVGVAGALGAAAVGAVIASLLGGQGPAGPAASVASQPSSPLASAPSAPPPPPPPPTSAAPSAPPSSAAVAGKNPRSPKPAPTTAPPPTAPPARTTKLKTDYP